MAINLSDFIELFNISNFTTLKSFIFSENFQKISLTDNVFIVETGIKHHILENKIKRIRFASEKIDMLFFEKECDKLEKLFNVNLSKVNIFERLNNAKQLSVIPIVFQSRLKYLVIILNISINVEEFVFIAKTIQLISENIFSKGIGYKKSIYIDRIFSKISSVIMIRDKNYNIIISNRKFSDEKYKCYDIAFGLMEPCEFCPINSTEITKKIGNKYYKIQQSFISPNFLCIVDDITSIIKLKEELTKSEKLSFLGKISSEITHELKNPLNSIKLKITLLEKLFNKKDDKVNKTFNGLYREIDRLSSLLNDFLQFGKYSKLNLQEFDLVALVNEIIFDFKEVLNNEKIHLEFYKEIENFILKGDYLKIKQSIYNLIKNSVEALKDVENKKIIINLEYEKNKIKIKIKDNGKGVENPEKLFSPFFTTKNFGTGLGLVIVKKNIEMHNGKIIYKREADFTVFEITFFTS